MQDEQSAVSSQTPGVPYQGEPEEFPPVEMPPHATAPLVTHRKGGGIMKALGTVLLFVLLFIAGVWASSTLRNYISQNTTPQPTLPQESSTIPLREGSDMYESFETEEETGETAWVEYGVISGVTKQEIPNVSFQMPSDVLRPVCDNTACSSQGTYLPGGTRFTIAGRGQGQILPNVGRATLTDAVGKEFTMTDTTVQGREAREFIGNFVGTTGGGYTFTNMRGVVIALTDELSIEFNHFAPSGLTTDFEADDVLFDQILATFTYGASIGEKGDAVPTSASSASPTATPSY